MTRLDGKVALVTGAAGGIGEAVAHQFIARGASVFLIDIDRDRLAALAAALGANAAFAVADAADEASSHAAYAAMIDRFGRVDVAILNAGTEGVVGRIGETSLADFDRVIAINLRSVFIGLSWLMPAMGGQGSGSIVIMSSVAGARGSVGLGPYIASKHGVVGLMKTAALEGARRGVRVNTVNPGAVDTRMMRSIEAGRAPEAATARRAATEAVIPMKRYGRPEEVAAMVAFLASDEASYCSGNSYFVDGGSLAGLAG
jgi:NAD(P)-dependent dehydrogenase (short-subunit alcohol dehydrogenase family)